MKSPISPKTIHAIVFSVVFGAQASVMALPVYWNTIRSKYPDAELSQRCNTCHKNSNALNPYGQDFAAVVLNRGTLSNPENWLTLGLMDSDEDGTTNADEIAVDRKPGKADAPADEDPEN